MRPMAATMALATLAGCSSLGSLIGPSQVYAVFFDGSSVTLTADARLIVDKAAKEASHQARDYVQISGPSSQALGGNPALAEARIRIVEQTLIGDGIAAERLVRASSTTTNVKGGTGDAQRVEIRLIDKPAG